MKILVTGGAGYIGSHTSVELLNKGYEIIVVDNLSNSKVEVLDRIRELTNRDFKFYRINLLNRGELDRVFKENKIDGVIHFAGLKAVGESVEKPLEYYHNNITGTLVLCDLMKEYGVKRLVFSSSATVYGNPERVPISEDFPLNTTNPYGSTKLMIERILEDLYISDREWGISLLRYFNPIGAHQSGRIGEDPNGIPNNLMPFITQVALGKLKRLSIFGNDYNTHDGTGVRDYIHVVDLAQGHLKALDKILEKPTLDIYNLGTGEGYSVLDMVVNFEKATGKKVDYTIVDRRPGDIDICYADPSKAERELGWKARRDIQDMCRDAWRWQINNPNGYE
ncbi:MAG TPA: UDP-glucose 4-epimerase GalE [Eubacteriaceae bacterium]|jgi:UDP-glucose 4-epimerase|nr:UDP-glucose 4-epimerase GalE [Eubacteriaceae bacterium]